MSWERITVALPPEQKAWLAAVAGAQGRTVAEFIRLLLPRPTLAEEQAAKEHEPKPAADPLKLPRSRLEAWREFLSYSGIEDYDAARGDTAWAKYKAGEGPKPKPFNGGTFDAVNEYLDLKGSQRVTGGLHAFELLTKGAKRWTDARQALKILREVPGLERLTWPYWVAERIATEELANRDADVPF